MENYEEKYNEIIAHINKVKSARCRRILGTYNNFYPEVQYIALDALNWKDVPHAIDLNSIYITFEIDIIKNKIKVSNCGSIYLLKEEMDATNMAMTSMKSVAVARNVKWMRTTKFEDAIDAGNKMCDFFEKVLDAVADYTGGYPYAQGIEWVNPNTKR